jgi:DNA-binding NarL/FixJ family response regulator
MDRQSFASEKFGTETATHLISVRAQEPSRAFASSRLQSGEDDEADYVLLVDPRALDRECLSRGLTEYDSSMTIVTVGSYEEWQRLRMMHEPGAILFMIGGKKVTDTDISERITSLTERFKSVPLIVGAESDELAQILKALECGAKGYIPTSVRINVAAEAIALARAGGVFVPASSILAAKEVIASVSNGTHPTDSLFTPREVVVAEALRRGKANKIIAYEMDLCESTVKVHIRNIMKKLNATNRTEVAYKIRESIR